MIIDGIEIAGLKHFGLSNIESIDIDISAPLQIILGSNGSGKSRLMYQMTPMPAATADFYPGGKKVFKTTHEGVRYKLSSIFPEKGNPHHSFIRYDDAGGEEELNQGGTATIQREMVETHLSFNTDYHKILTGNLRFTEMSPTQVMNLMMKISDLNLNYAIGIHDKLKESSRDNVGILKHVRTKLADAQTRLAEMEDPELIASNIESHRERIRTLLPLSVKKTDRTEHELKATIERSNESFHRLEQEANRRGVMKVLNTSYKSYEDLVKDLESVQKQMGINEQMKVDRYAQLERLQGDLGRVRDNASDADPEILKKEIELMEQKIAGLSETPHVFGFKAEIMVNQLKELISTINSKTIGLPPIEHLDRANIDLRLANYDSSKKHVGHLETELVRIKDLLRHAEHSSSDDVTCVQCGTVNLAQGSKTAETKETMRSEIERLGKELDNYVAEHKRIEADYEAAQLFSSTFNDFKNILFPYRQIVDELEPNISNYFIKTSSTVAKLTEELVAQERLAERDKLAIDVDKKRNLLILIESSDVERLCAEEKRITGELEEINAESMLLFGRETNLKRTVAHYDFLSGSADTSEELITATTEAMKDLFDLQLSSMAEHEMRENESLLGVYVSQQNKRTHLQAIVDDLLVEEEKAIQQKKEDDILIEQVSPKTGIIAEQLDKFMKSFFFEVNKVLADIFEYSIEVTTKDGDKALDYKFPLVVEGKDSGEVTTGSDGQKDVINLAFCIVLMSVLKMNGYPLYMDEVGSTFDDMHRANLMNYVKTLLETGHVSQIFMISHFSSMHGGLANYESLVLHSANLDVVPDNANKHATIR